VYPLKTYFDKIKLKVKSGKPILTKKRSYAKSEVWKSFREIQDAAKKEKISADQFIKCQSVLS
jgi:hypothetical protein